jgi:site-specific DNA recombinase
MIRAAIYARFSSDLQSDKSIDDQIALCRDVCAREGMAVVMTFEDRAISGTATVNRPGFQSMMRTAEAKLFDVLVIEDVDRLSRDQGDYHSARKRLDFLGINIHAATGKVGKLDGALRALMGEMFIENLVLHVRRGMDGVVRDGRHAGGRAYGYEPVPGKSGELRIVEAEAEVVRSIFADYIAGASPRKIAAALNVKAVKPPRGKAWNASTINGNMQRGGGILLNELYAGRIVWNKVRMVKDPNTGRRISRPNPKSEHRIADAPHLRIVDGATWQAAQKVKQANSMAFGPTKGRPKRPFAGLIRCASCGGSMVMAGGKNGGRVQCSAFKEKGTCKNGRRVPVAKIESLVLTGLRENLTNPAAIAAFVDTYNEERQRLRKQATKDRSRMERRTGEINRELDRLVDAIAKSTLPLDIIAPRMNELKGERDQIAGELREMAESPDVIALHPTALKRYKRAVVDLAEALATDQALVDNPAPVFDAIRALVSAVVVTAPPNSESFEVEVKGRLAELCGIEAFPHRSRVTIPLVAGEGLEPPTPGL